MWCFCIFKKQKKKVNEYEIMQEILKKTWNTITTILVSLVVFLAVLLWGFRLVGYEILIVQSGSMEPAYHVGALVYVKPVVPTELEVGDVITFELGNGVRGTHRIIEIVKENNEFAFRTKGDANEVEDQNLVRPEKLVGEVKFTIPYLGFLVSYIQQPPGTYIMISVIATLLLLTILPDLIFSTEKKIKNEEDN